MDDYIKTADNLLNKIVQYLKQQNIQYHNSHQDGRINSSTNEKQILDLLEALFRSDDTLKNNHYCLKLPNIREWYDFAIINTQNSDCFIPVNIKVTNLQTDNLNCKLGIYFALTGKLPTHLSNEKNWETFFQMLDKDLNTFKDKDYYFLVANKNDNTDYFYNSLKRLENLVANGNNIPFQTNWAKNKTPQPRTHAEAGYFILNCFKQSVYKRAEMKESFQTYIEPHLENYKKDIGTPCN